MPPLQRAPLDYATLAANLAALGYPIRLELLDQLRFPHTLGQIRITPQRGDGGAERASARQTVRHHLDKLIEVGLVAAEEVQEGGRPTHRYTVDPTRLYALTEELRRLSVNYAGAGRGGDATGTLQGAPSTRREAAGPRLVLVHGVFEGKEFPLAPATSRGGRWVVGRSKEVPVSLDYDPFVSVENCAVVQRGGDYEVVDLGSKNGTAVNWAPLPRGGAAPLKPGYVLGVGRSLLCFVVE